MRSPGSFAVVILSLIFGVVGGGIGAYLFARPPKVENAKPVMIRTQAPDGAGLPVAKVQVSTEKDAIVRAVESISPAAVKVIGRLQPKNWTELWMSGGVLEGVGSGFIFEYEGRKLVLTNTHVIGDFTDLSLKLTDGRELKARPLGRMQQEDLAVLEIIDPPSDLVAAPLGNSDALQQGEWVIAVGNPFNFEQTVTVGVVSATGMRRVGEVNRNVIQTDAAVNAGNSGGPLVDLAGNVVGINFAIYDPQGNRVATTVGIGFAIPINQAKELMYLLVHRGPYLGLPANLLMPNSVGFARRFNIATDKGLVILNLYETGPAADAGLRPGDVIMQIDGTPASTREEFQEAVFKHKIGDAIRFTVLRGKTELEVEIIAGTAPEDFYL